MSRVRVHNFSISLDGFGTGEGQTFEAPFGHAGHRLNEWFFPTRTFQEMQGKSGGNAGIDDAFAKDWGHGIGAEIMGRNKFGHQRGPWVDEEWKGWWGDDPPFHTPVFILTHHPRPAINMKGGTTFHFMDAGPAEALEAAREAAGGLAEDQQPFDSSWQPISSTTCMSLSCRSFSDAGNGCGTVSKNLSSASMLRRSVRQAALRISLSPADRYAGRATDAS